MGNKNTRHSIVVTAAATFVCGMLLLPPANAMMEREMSVFGDAVELSDDEMGEMRGRFLSGNTISYFGVEMYTRWTNSFGETLTTGLVLGTAVGSSVQIRPTVTIFHVSENTAEATENVQAGTGTTFISSSGLDNVNGITQAVQVAGDGNRLSNELTIDIGPAGSTSRLDIEGTTIAVNGPGTTVLGDGTDTMVTFSLTKEGFGYTISNQGQDRITQRILGGITQRVQIATNLNQIINVTNIIAETRQLAVNLQRPLLNTAFQSLRGIQTLGIF